MDIGLLLLIGLIIVMISVSAAPEGSVGDPNTWGQPKKVKLEDDDMDSVAEKIYTRFQEGAPLVVETHAEREARQIRLAAAEKYNYLFEKACREFYSLNGRVPTDAEERLIWNNIVS